MTQKDDIKWCPNPVKDILYINTNAPYESLEIIDLVGRVIYREELRNKNDFEIFMTDLPRGYYIMRLRNSHIFYDSMEIIDLLGKVIYNKEFRNKTDYRISMNDVPSGYYIVRFRNRNTVENRLIVIQ